MNRIASIVAITLFAGGGTAFAQQHGGGGRPSGGGHPTGGGHSGGAYHGGGGGNVYHGGGNAYHGGGNVYHGGGYSNYGRPNISFGIGIGTGFGGYGYSGFGYRPYGYGNYGYSNYGYGGYPNYGYSVPLVAGGSYLYTAPAVVVVPTVVSGSSIVPTPGNLGTPGGEYGLRITELTEGSAKLAGLRRGDIILAVDGRRTQSFGDLRATLGMGMKQVTIEYIDGSSGEVERKPVSVVDTKIGVTIDEVPVKRS